MSIPGSASPLFLSAAAAAAPTGYQIDRSVRLNSADSAYFSRTPSSAGNRKTWTWSGWVKRSKFDGTRRTLLRTNSSETHISFSETAQGNSESLMVYGASGGGYLLTDAVFRDPSAWYHIVVAWDTTQATNTNRVKIYVNGVQIESFYTSTYPNLNHDGGINAATAHGLGANSAGGELHDGYLADVHFIDGQALAPTDFGEYDDNNVWQPKAYSGTYGTNGFHLDFSDNSSNAALGTDSSGNSNTWTVNNLSVASGAGNDSLIDTPTNYTAASGNNGGNYATLNPLAGKLTVTLSDGNLTREGSVANNRMGTIGMSSGKWYWEVLIQDLTALNFLGVTTYETEPDGYAENYVYSSNGSKWVGTSNSSYGASMSVNDIIGLAYDADTGSLTAYRNGVSQGVLTSGISKTAFPLSRTDGTGKHTFNFGQRPFAYTPPTGYLSLCTQNLTDPTIADGSTAMDVALYTGNGTSQSITGLGFSPDFVWIKSRSDAYGNVLHDIVRGANAQLVSNLTVAESSNAQYLTSFDSTGFSVGSNNAYNENTKSYVGWAWDAGTGSPVSNTDGSITSSVLANASAGFSIVTFTTGTAAFSVGHGLSTAPKLVIHKDRDNSYIWTVYHADLGPDKYLTLNSSAAATTSSGQFGTGPTNSVVNFSSGYANNNDGVAYCFAPVEGYSAFGSYEGSSSLPFVYLGFKPALVIVKNADAAADWKIYDSTRDPDNAVDSQLYPSASYSESDGDRMDFLSNGFKLRTNGSEDNGSGNTMIYAAFSEHPFKTARAR